MIAYKLLTLQKDGRFTGFCKHVQDRDRGARIYAKGVVTKRARRHGPLATFRTKKAALSYQALHERLGGYIAKAEVVESPDGIMWLRDTDGTKYPAYPPNGTILCDSIALLETPKRVKGRGR